MFDEYVRFDTIDEGRYFIESGDIEGICLKIPDVNHVNSNRYGNYIRFRKNKPLEFGWLAESDEVISVVCSLELC